MEAPGEDFVPPAFESEPATKYPINLAVSLENVQYAGVISAPEGKKLSFTVNGQEMPLCSGKYRGDIRLNIV